MNDHNLIETFLVPGALAISILFSIILYRLWPVFLRVDGKVTIWFVLKKMLVNTLLVLITLTIVTVIASLLLDPFSPKS